MEKLSNMAKSFDSFGTQAGLNVKGEQDFKTSCGACLSIFTFLTTLAFFIIYTISVFSEKDLLIVTSQEPNYFDDT